MKHLFPSGAVRGTATNVSVIGKLGEQRVFAWCSRDDVVVEPSSEAEKLTITTPVDAPPGICWIRLYNSEGSAGLRPFVIGLHAETIEVEPNNWLKQAQPIEPGTIVVNGQLSTNEDVDAYSMSLEAGETLIASMVANKPLGSPMDGLLQIVTPDGFVLEQNDDDQELDPRIVFTAPADGTYLVRTFAFPAATNQSIRFHHSAEYIYRLTLTTGPFIDHTWPLAVAAESEPQVQLRGWNLTDDFQEVLLTLVPSEELGIFFDRRLANTVKVPVVPHAVGVEPVADEAKNIQFPVTISGRIDKPGQVDEYTFQATKGQNLVFKIESREAGHPLDPLLVLLGPDGKVLSEADDTTRGTEDVSLSHQIGADGEYRIQVLDRFNDGGFRFVYRLTATVAQPVAALTVASDSFTLTKDKPLEVDVSINRQYGFAADISVGAVDLPAGVTVQPVTSAKEGDTSKSVKLVFEAGQGIDCPGTFRIVGTTMDDSPIEISATTALSAFDAQVSELWLNVPNPKLPKNPIEAKRPE